jgi:ketosteroid isomerase-like protein
MSAVLSLMACYAQNRGSNDVTIKKLESEFEAALAKGDAKTLEDILSDDYIQIDAQGGLKKKADVIGLLRSMSRVNKGESIGPEKKVDEFAISIRGDWALVVGRVTTRYQFMEYQRVGPPPAGSQDPVAVDQERFIRVYSKVGSRWQLISWQTTAIAKR